MVLQELGIFRLSQYIASGTAMTIGHTVQTGEAFKM